MDGMMKMGRNEWMGSEWDEGLCTATTTAGTTPIALWSEVKLGIPEGR